MIILNTKYEQMKVFVQDQILKPYTHSFALKIGLFIFNLMCMQDLHQKYLLLF